VQNLKKMLSSTTSSKDRKTSELDSDERLFKCHAHGLLSTFMQGERLVSQTCLWNASPHVFVDSGVGTFLESCLDADTQTRLDREEAQQIMHATLAQGSILRWRSHLQTWGEESADK
jgi:hypothetical protein